MIDGQVQSGKRQEVQTKFNNPNNLRLVLAAVIAKWLRFSYRVVLPSSVYIHEIREHINFIRHEDIFDSAVLVFSGTSCSLHMILIEIILM